MEIFIMDENFTSLYNIDIFESLIWTERYNGYGDFEFYTPVNNTILQVVDTIQKKMEKFLDCYVYLKEAKSYMIIENIEIKTNIETGNHLIVSGRGLESILERRIIWDQTVLNGNLQNGIKKILNNNIINPKIEDRKISNFIFSSSSNEDINKMTIRSQYTGDNLYDVIYQICEEYQLGFDIYYLDHDFIFCLTIGSDRSYAQIKNPYIIFSPKYENLLNTDYLESIKTLKNVTLVAGEGEGSSRKTRVIGSAFGLSRREIYTDARDIQSEKDDGTYLTDSEYNDLLDQRGNKKLSENKYTKVFTGEIDSQKNFIYGVDFFKGDIVQILNEYGMESRVRVSEIIRVQDTSGISIYPTFQVVT